MQGVDRDTSGAGEWLVNDPETAVGQEHDLVRRASYGDGLAVDNKRIDLGLSAGRRPEGDTNRLRPRQYEVGRDGRCAEHETTGRQTDIGDRGFGRRRAPLSDHRGVRNTYRKSAPD